MMLFDRHTVALACLLGVLLPSTASATMPMLTDQPRPATQEACMKWAAEQDEEARDMWGTLKSGMSSLEVGTLRLALNCLGDDRPEIVGFHSSAGAAASYCKKYFNQPICKAKR